MVNQEHGYCIKQNLCSRLSRQLGPTKWKMEMEEGDQKVLVPSSFLELVQKLKLLFHYGYPGGKKKVMRREWLFSAFYESHYSKQWQATPLWLYSWLLALNFHKYTCERKCYMWKFTFCFDFENGDEQKNLSLSLSEVVVATIYLIKLWTVLYRPRWKNTHIFNYTYNLVI